MAYIAFILVIQTLTGAVENLDKHLSRFDELGIRATADLRQFDSAKDEAQNNLMPPPTFLPNPGSRLQQWATPSPK